MGLESGGGLVAEGGVFAVDVVVGFDGGEALDVGLGVGDERAVRKHFGLAGADEGRGPGVVVGMGARGHALADAGRAPEFPESAAAVWTAPVAEEEQAGQGAAAWEKRLRGPWRLAQIGRLPPPVVWRRSAIMWRSWRGVWCPG